MKQSTTSLFVVELTYTAPLAQIDAAMTAHMAFLRKCYRAGHFLVSGRQVPRDGGIILAIGESRQQIEAIMRDDPFCARGLATARVIQFRASQYAEAIGERIDGGAHRRG
jgi:uncharacterized protein YciI